MDRQRTIRFLYPPILFLGSMLWAIKADPKISLASLIPRPFDEGVAGLVGLAAGGGVVIVGLGYALGTSTYSGLWLWALVRRHLPWLRSANYEFLYDAPVSTETKKRMLERLGVPESDRKHVPPLVYVVAFDHGLLNPRIHDWIQRRWQMLHTSVNATVALVAAFLASTVLIGARIDFWWCSCSVLGVVLFVLHARKTWEETRDMLEFQSRGPFPPRAASMTGPSPRATESENAPSSSPTDGST